jgi:hypothetical protein
MNENNKSFYTLNMFEFIYHPEYGCRNLKGLMNQGKGSSWKKLKKLQMLKLLSKVQGFFHNQVHSYNQHNATQ